MSETKKKKNLSVISKSKSKYRSKSDLEKEIGELRCVLGAQELTNKKLQKALVEKEEEIQHLKDLLVNSNPVERVELQEEELIAEIQLQNLRGIAQNRDLTLEEARKFEIFSKVKGSANKNRPIVPQYKKLPNNLSQKELIQIAEGHKKKDDK